MENLADSGVFGKEVGLVHKAIVAGRKVGAGRDFWIKLADQEEFFIKVMRLFLGIDVYTFIVSVNGHSNFQDMVNAGNYDFVDSIITDRYRPYDSDLKYTCKVSIVRIETDLDQAEVLKVLDEECFAPSTPELLLALGETYPNLQKMLNPIVAIGSFYPTKIYGPKYRLCLDYDYRGRLLKVSNT